MSVLGDKLKVVLANSFAFYLKAHYFHWNVEGPEFPQYHDLFAKIYEEVYASIDLTAEYIRTLDEYAPGSFKRFEELSTIETKDTIPSARAMLKELLSDNDKVIGSIIIAMELAGKSPTTKSIENFLQERLDSHQKHAWMLRATVK
jgi:starvation-inducible DNA-binding protein